MYQKKEVIKILRWQIYHHESNTKTVKKFSVSINSLKKWQKRYLNSIKQENNAILIQSQKQTEIQKFRFKIKHIERINHILDASFDKLNELIPLCNDVRITIQILQIITDVVKKTKSPLNPWNSNCSTNITERLQMVERKLNRVK